MLDKNLDEGIQKKFSRGIILNGFKKSYDPHWPVIDASRCAIKGLIRRIWKRYYYSLGRIRYGIFFK